MKFRAHACLGLAFGAFLALAGPAFAQAEQPAPAAALAPEDVAELAAEALSAAQDRQARMTVPVMVDGSGPYHFVVDTGSERSAIAKDIAVKLGLTKGKPVMVHAANASQKMDTAVVRQLQVGSSKPRRLEAILVDREATGVDGMLGIDLMRNQQIVMDFKAAKLSVEPAKKERFDAMAVVVPGRSLYGQLILADVQVRGRSMFVVLDSGSEVTVANIALARALTRPDPTQPPVQIIGVTGAVSDARAAVLPDVKMGSIVIRSLGVVFTDLPIFARLKLDDRPAMLLGMDVLRKFDRVAVNFERKQAAFNMAADVRPFSGL